MHVTRLSLLAWSMLTCAPLASAKAPAPVPVAATPLNAPGEWLGTDDYPATALRFDMTGITAFRLTVDVTGKPSRCDIIESSGFDVLDTATCQRVMANARFSPASDHAGKPVEGTYTNRVRWVLPPDAKYTVAENFVSAFLSIDETGNFTSCRFVIHVPAGSPASTEDPCKQSLKSIHPMMGLEIRGSFQGSSAEVVFQSADVFTPAIRARVLAPIPGYEQRGLNIHHFTVTSDGELGQCHFEQQRGSELLTTDFCKDAQGHSFDPPFAAIDEGGTARGWHIWRVLLKTSNKEE